MSYTFLLEQGEESSVECFSDIPQSVLLRLNLTADKSCSNASEMESSPSSQSGMMSARLTAIHGMEKLTSCAVDFHARNIQPSEKFMVARDLMDGQTPFALLGKQDQNSSGWKMSQQFLPGIGGELLPTFPTWGIAVDGVCFQLAPLVLHTHENGCFVWRTPAASDWKRRNLGWKSVQKPGNPLCLPQQIAQLGYLGYVNPTFLACLMGWPDTWANLKPLETDKFRQWLDSHGKP